MQCLTLLSTIAVWRLDESGGADDIESVLVSALMGAESSVEVSKDPLASSIWEKVKFDVLISSVRSLC